MDEYAKSLLQSSSQYQTLPLLFLSCLVTAKLRGPVSTFAEYFSKCVSVFRNLINQNPLSIPSDFVFYTSKRDAKDVIAKFPTASINTFFYLATVDQLKPFDPRY